MGLRSKKPHALPAEPAQAQAPAAGRDHTPVPPPAVSEGECQLHIASAEFQLDRAQQRLNNLKALIDRFSLEAPGSTGPRCA